MKRNVLLLLAAALLLPLAISAGSDSKKEAAPANHSMHEDEDDDAVEAESSWGAKLPQALTVSFWSAKDGEGSASKIITSREVFAISFSMGKEGKEGMIIELGGRIFPRADGSFELLLEIEAKGGDANKGAMALELQNSALIKKGQATLLFGHKEEKFFVKID